VVDDQAALLADLDYHQDMAARDLVAEALRLSAAERGRIVRELIDSLDRDETNEPGEVERAWATELESRATDLLGGDSSGRDLATVCAELESRRPAKK
jgi:putative addiction module component (TIGR02574 family)